MEAMDLTTARNILEACKAGKLLPIAESTKKQIQIAIDVVNLESKTNHYMQMIQEKKIIRAPYAYKLSGAVRAVNCYLRMLRDKVSNDGLDQAVEWAAMRLKRKKAAGIQPPSKHEICTMNWFMQHKRLPEPDEYQALVNQCVLASMER